MKILFLVYILLSFTNAFSADEYWIKKNSPTTRNLKSVFFLNVNTGWISGDSGTIARTTNAGINWTIQNTFVNNDIQAFHFINERLGWAISWEVFPDSNSYLGTKILKTTNGGVNWTSFMYPDTNYFMKTIFFLDSLKGFMAGAPLTIVYTTNAGASWNKADTDTSLIIGFPIENLKFINSQTGYACGGFRDLAGSMWRTSNGGINWFATVVGPEPLNDLYIFSPTKAIATGGDFEYGSSIVKTYNQGSNWFYDTLGTFGVANGIDFRTPYEGWISLGISQKFSFTLDSGNTWRSIFSPDSIPMFDIDFIDSANGWAVGYKGAIMKYNYIMSGIVPGNETNEANVFALYQNYPNPFNPVTIIKYKLENANNVLLKVYDALGKEISILVNERQNSGIHSVSFNGINLPSGIYFYELKSAGYSTVNKMLLLK